MPILNANPSTLLSVLGSASGGDTILLETGSYGGMEFRNFVFTSPVIVQSEDEQGGAFFTLINFRDSAFLDFRYINLDQTGLGGTGLGYVSFTGATDCAIRHSIISGDSTRTVIDSSYGVYARSGSLRNTVQNCLITNWNKAVLSIGGDGLTVDGCVFDEVGGDDIHISSADSITITNNWFARNRKPDATEHMDNSQFINGGSGHVWNGNVGMYGLNPTSIIQGGFWNGGQFHDATAEQNILLTNTVNGMKLSDNSTAGSSGFAFDRNTLLSTTDHQNTNYACIASINNGEVSKDYNVVAAPIGTNGGAGPNGIALQIESTFTEAQYDAEYGSYYTGPLKHGTPFSAFHPVEGARTHWDHPNPTGAAQRLKEIFVDGIHPGNAGWPVADAWNQLYNADGGITQGTEPMPDTITITSIDAIRSTPNAPAATAVIEADNTITINANDPDYTGLIEVDYTVTDAETPPQTASATIFATFSGSAPVAADDVVSGPKGVAINLDPKLNDTAD